MSGDELDVKISNRSILLFCGFLLFSIFFYALFLSYDIGFYNGGSKICNPLSLGVDLEGEYLCFNKSLQQQVVNSGYNFNVSMEGLEWS